MLNRETNVLARQFAGMTPEQRADARFDRMRRELLPRLRAHSL